MFSIAIVDCRFRATFVVSFDCSFGCSGVYKQKDGQFIGGNEAVTDFINDIQGRQSVNKDKSLQIQYISRDTVNWRQNIDSVNSKTDE